MKLFVIIILVVFVACNSTTDVRRSSPHVNDTRVTACDFTCSQLRDMGCDESRATLTQRSCVDASDCAAREVCSDHACAQSCEISCERAEFGGQKYNIECVVLAMSCENVRQCKLQ